MATESSFISDGRGNILPFPRLMLSGNHFVYVIALCSTVFSCENQIFFG